VYDADSRLLTLPRPGGLGHTVVTRALASELGADVAFSSRFAGG